jgi:hypothetical protein
VLVQLANANARATKNANLKIMRAVLTSPSARYKQNRGAVDMLPLEISRSKSVRKQFRNFERIDRAQI